MVVTALPDTLQRLKGIADLGPLNCGLGTQIDSTQPRINLETKYRVTLNLLDKIVAVCPLRFLQTLLIRPTLPLRIVNSCFGQHRLQN